MVAAVTTKFFSYFSNITGSGTKCAIISIAICVFIDEFWELIKEDKKEEKPEVAASWES